MRIHNRYYSVESTDLRNILKAKRKAIQILYNYEKLGDRERGRVSVERRDRANKRLGVAEITKTVGSGRCAVLNSPEETSVEA